MFVTFYFFHFSIAINTLFVFSMSRSNQYELSDFELSDDEYEVLTVGKKKDVTSKKNPPTQKKKSSTVIIKKRKTRSTSPSNSIVSSSKQVRKQPLPSDIKDSASKSAFEYPYSKTDDDLHSAIVNSIIISHCRFDIEPVRANVVPYYKMLEEARKVLGYSGSTAVKMMHKKFSSSYSNIKNAVLRIRSIYPYDYVNGYFYSHPSDELLRSVMVTRTENDLKLKEYNDILHKLGFYLLLYILHSFSTNNFIL